MFTLKRIREKMKKFGRFIPVVVLLFILLICALLTSLVGYTISYYSTQLAPTTATIGIAKWDVKVSLDNTNINMISNEWSTPYKIEIKNDSEVLATYGYEGEKPEESMYSFLTFSNLPDEITEVRIFDPSTGNIADISGGLQNNSIAIRFTGSLYPGNSRTYFVQFFSELGKGNSQVSSSTEITVDANFHYEQALTEVNESVNGVVKNAVETTN